MEKHTMQLQPVEIELLDPLGFFFNGKLKFVSGFDFEMLPFISNFFSKILLV